MQSQPRCRPPTAPGTAGGGEGAALWEENSGPAVLGRKEGTMRPMAKGPSDRGVEPAGLGEATGPTGCSAVHSRPAAGSLEPAEKSPGAPVAVRLGWAHGQALPPLPSTYSSGGVPYKGKG